MNTSPVQDLVKALSNQDLGIGEEALKWVQDVLNRGIQTNRMSELFAPSNHTPTAGIDGNTFLFERTLWLRAVDKSTGAPR